MPTVILPTVFETNPYDPSWADRDFFHSPDGVQEFPNHHCKQTFMASLPFLVGRRNAIDVGCRDGEYTRYLQQHFGHAYCFDPRRRSNFAYNVDLSKATHFTCALGDEPGEIKMYGGTHAIPDDAARGKRATVPCLTLDSFGLTDVDYIKVDVEGFEKKVLMGAAQTIARDRPLIVIEQNDVMLEGATPYDARDWLLERGYKVVATCPRGWDQIMLPA